METTQDAPHGADIGSRALGHCLRGSESFRFFSQALGRRHPFTSTAETRLCREHDPVSHFLTGRWREPGRVPDDIWSRHRDRAPRAPEKPGHPPNLQRLCQAKRRLGGQRPTWSLPCPDPPCFLSCPAARHSPRPPQTRGPMKKRQQWRFDEAGAPADEEAGAWPEPARGCLPTRSHSVLQGRRHQHLTEDTVAVFS